MSESTIDFVIFRADGSAERASVPDDGTFTPFCPLLGCRIIEPVGIRRAGMGDGRFALLCDEEALLVDPRPPQNFVATILAGAPIFGDVALVGDDGERYVSVSERDIEEILAAAA